MCPFCPDQEVETLSHRFFGCESTKHAAAFLLDMVRTYEQSITEEKCLLFNLITDALYELHTILVLEQG